MFFPLNNVESMPCNLHGMHRKPFQSSACTACQPVRSENSPQGDCAVPRARRQHVTLVREGKSWNSRRVVLLSSIRCCVSVCLTGRDCTAATRKPIVRQADEVRRLVEVETHLEQRQRLRFAVVIHAHAAVPATCRKNALVGAQRQRIDAGFRNAQPRALCDLRWLQTAGEADDLVFRCATDATCAKRILTSDDTLKERHEGTSQLPIVHARHGTSRDRQVLTAS